MNTNRKFLKTIDEHFIKYPWSLIDLTSYLLFMMGFALRGSDEAITRRLLTGSLLLMYLKFFEVLLIFRIFGVKIFMIRMMVNSFILYLQFLGIIVHNIADKT